MKRFQNVLLALDVTGRGFGKDEALPARVKTVLSEARWLVEKAGAKLTVITVVEATDTEDVRTAAMALLENVARPRLGDTPADLEVAVGVPFVQICRYVAESGTDLVLVASRRPSLLDRSIVGSTALRLLRKCPCAVWVAGRHMDPGGWAVLSTVGSHRLARSILETAADIVALRGGEWHVLHCVEYPQEGGMRLRHRPQEEIDAYRKGVREEDWSTLKSLTQEIAAERGLTPSLWLAEGTPSERISLAVEEQDAHLVVMGTVGRGGLPGVLIGNTAEKVFKHTQCSILAVKPDDFASPVKPAGA